MTTISRVLPGWFRRGKGRADEQTRDDDQPQPAAQASGTSVATTGGEGETEPVVVWEAQNRMEAEVVKGHLASEGIPALITGDVAGRIFGFHTGDLAKASVLVPAPLADRAREILEAALVEDETVDDDEYAEEIEPSDGEDSQRGMGLPEA